MEEKVGELWHRLITRMAQTRHPQAAVTLSQMKPTVGILFRALGGDGGLQVQAAQASEHGARRSLLQRLAGDGRITEMAWRDHQSLRLPSVIDQFPHSQLNRDLYIWLTALAAGAEQHEEPWFSRNQRLTVQALRTWPGLRTRYHRLVQAHLAQRILPDARFAAESAQERAIRSALMEPGSVERLPHAGRPPQPVLLWLHPFPPVATNCGPAIDDEQDGSSRHGNRTLELADKKQAERSRKPEAKNRGLVTVRMENIFTWAGFLNLDRGSEENEDLDNAADVAKDMDLMSIGKDAKASAGKLRFDMDLPAAAEDDQVLHGGILLPEWDYKRQQMQPGLCRLLPMLAADAAPCALPDHLRRTATKLRHQFQHLAQSRIWQRGQQEGSEIDLDAFLRFTADRSAGRIASADGLYKDMRINTRDLACLLLADLSLSTDTWVNNHARVIDVIRDSLFLFAESLTATGDRFAMYGFSSRKRDPIRFHQLKTFEEPYTAGVRGRIKAIKPGYYTRMGAAIRQASNLLAQQPARCRLLLILSDGKPNDLDKYEGRYGIEDTRKALHEAKQLGLQPFCVTVDTTASEYLPHLFGSGGYAVIHKPSQLPKALPSLYARLTSNGSPN